MDVDRADPGGDGRPARDAAPDWEERRLGLPSASALVVANMIGAGLFTTSGFALADLGEPRWVVLAWVVGGGVAVCGALAYGGIASRIPVSGGEAIYLARTVHPVLGFMAGWLSALAGFAAPIAAAALALEAYLGTALGGSVPRRLTGATVIGAAALLHALRPRLGTSSLTGLVVLKLVLLLGFLGWGAAESLSGAPVPRTTVALDWSVFAVTLVWISFSYSGWNGAIYLAGEIREPERNLRRALVVPTIGVSLLYVATNALFVHAGPVEALAGRADIGAAAAGMLGGRAAERAVAFVVCLALLSSISVMVLSGPRVLAQLARDGMLPAALARGRVAPSRAIAFQALLAIAIVFVADLAELIATLGFALGLSAAGTVAVAALLRQREGPERVPIPGHPFVPLAFIGFTLWGSMFLVLRSPGRAAVGTALLLAGIPAWWIARRARPRVREGA